MCVCMYVYLCVQFVAQDIVKKFVTWRKDNLRLEEGIAAEGRGKCACVCVLQAERAERFVKTSSLHCA